MDRRDSDGEEEEQVDGEDENWRVQRLEREKWLKGRFDINTFIGAILLSGGNPNTCTSLTVY